MNVSISPRRVVRFGVFELDERSGELRKGDTRLNLPDQPLQFLTALLQRPGELVTRDELRQHLWPGETFVDFEHGLNAAVKRLRDTLGDSADTPRFIETVPRRGYRFIAPVSRDGERAESADLLVLGNAQQTSDKPGSVDLDARGPSGHPQEDQASAAITRPGQRWMLAAAVGVLLLSLPAIAFLAGRRTAERPLPTFQRLTFRRGLPLSARFAPDGRTILYSAAWDGDPVRTFSTRIERPESLRFDGPDAEIEAVSASGELLITLNRNLGDFWSSASWTLARVPMGGGAPRAIAEHVLGADWGPDDSIALARQKGDRFQLEYPSGHVLYDADARVTSPRVSPDGQRVAFFAFTPQSMDVMVVDRSGKARLLSSGWKWGGKHLLWSRTGDEVWFTASEGGWVGPLRAVSLQGRQRVLLRLPASLTVQDLSADGRLLLTVGSAHTIARCLSAGENRERDMTWFESSMIQDLSFDGTTALISEVAGGAGPGREAATYIRKTDGSPPVRLGEAFPLALSPDGRWVLTHSERTGRYDLLPTGAGDPVRLDIPGFRANSWFPDSKRLLLERDDTSARCYSLIIGKGEKPQPLMPEGIQCLGASPFVPGMFAANANGTWATYSVASGAIHHVPGLTATDTPIQWGADGLSWFVQRTGLPVAQIDQVAIQTGARHLWREIAVSDPAGIVRAQSGVTVAPNGSYCYTYMQHLGELDLVQGIQ